MSLAIPMQFVILHKYRKFQTVRKSDLICICLIPLSQFRNQLKDGKEMMSFIYNILWEIVHGRSEAEEIEERLFEEFLWTDHDVHRTCKLV